jgi:hypothetical protein
MNSSNSSQALLAQRRGIGFLGSTYTSLPFLASNRVDHQRSKSSPVTQLLVLQ